MKKLRLLKRLRAKKQTQSLVLGVTWYTEENWARVKSTATDPERFEATYIEWEAMALEALANINKSGVNAVKNYIDPDELLAWCQLHNRPNNASSRSEFVAEKLHSQNTPGA